MPDDTLDMPEAASAKKKTISAGEDLPVKTETLILDGSRPEKGDEVEVTVKGTVSRIVDDCCYVTLETANNEPIHNPEPEKEPETEGDMLGLAEKADMAGLPYG